MPDEQTTPPVAPQPNTPEARTETGEIRDQQSTQPTKDPVTSTTTPSTDPKADAKTEPAKPDDKAKPAAVPEKYEFKAAEGAKLDEKFIAEATPVLKELGLTNDQAQKLMSLYDKQVAALAEGPYKAFQDLQNEWRTKVFSDPALGNGTELKPEVKASISHAIDSLPNAKGFREAMEVTGAGNNPEFVKAFAHIAKQLGEGTSVTGGGPSKLGQQAPDAKPKSAASAIYPNLPSSGG